MSTFFQSIFEAFLSPLGLLALATLDSSMLFFLPVAVDAAVIILSARYSELFWVFPLLATTGSLVGASITFWIGRKIGENSLEIWVPKARLQRIRSKLKDKGAIALAVPALMPPPFPLTPFVLACGAFNVSKLRFFPMLGFMRFLRFGTVSVLGLLYGRRIVRVLESDVFKGIVTFFILIALAGTAYTTYRLVVTTRSYRRRGRASGAEKTA
jgi:membrane protein YqaA with SNARE-associated domain